MESELPEGCKLCIKGSKMVLFVTGVCEKNCFYCPLSKERKGKDVVFADEVRVRSDLDVILECKAIDAEGTGITGGDPLMRLSRTLRYIRLLKREFGREHHIHLYTNGKYANREILSKLKNAGLDEIRFHPTKNDWGKIAIAKELGMYAGAEVPAIPGRENEIKELIRYLEEIKADFLNINQLEFSPENALRMKQRGFALEEGEISSVKGSEEVAKKVIDWARSEGIGLLVHYCPSYVKDSVQTRMRLIRRAKNVARPYEKISEDGLVGKIVVKGCWGNPRIARKKVADLLGVPLHAIGISEDGNLETHRDLLEPLEKLIKDASFEFVQVYPTYGREKFAVYPC